MFHLERLLRMRDRILTNPAFHRFATRNALTGFFAQRYARSLFDICAGFVYSQVLFAAVQLDIFTRLAREPADAETLAAELKLPVASLKSLLNACVSLKLADLRPGNRYGIAALGAATLANPIVPAMVKHHALLYADMRDPIELLKNGSEGTRQAAFWAYAAAGRPAELGAADVGDYSHLMATSQASVAEAVLDAYSFAHHRRLLDIGGGEGVFLARTLARNPSLSVMLMDLPAVVERARARLAGAERAGRVVLYGGSFFDDPIPTGADAVSLVRVLFDHDDDAVLKLLQAIRRSLATGATILIAEPILDQTPSDPIKSAYFAFYLLAMGRGKLRTANTHFALLNKAGFSAGRTHPVPERMLTGVITARAT